MDARRSARNSPCAHKAREGVKGGTLAGGPPFAGGSAARSPCAPPWGWRWTKERVVEDADPYGGWETGHVPHNMPRDHPTPGRGPVERGGVGGNLSSGTSGTPSPTGQPQRRGAGGHPAPTGLFRVLARAHLLLPRGASRRLCAASPRMQKCPSAHGGGAGQ